jgi:hypothetical protein
MGECSAIKHDAAAGGAQGGIAGGENPRFDVDASGVGIRAIEHQQARPGLGQTDRSVDRRADG